MSVNQLSVLHVERRAGAAWAPLAWLGKEMAAQVRLRWDEDGQLTEVQAGVPQEQAMGEDIPVFTGLLCPGWINAHTHLELSHMAEFRPRPDNPAHAAPGMAEFGRQVVAQRNTYTRAQQHGAAQEAVQQLWSAGVAGVGDIANGPLTATLTLPQGLQRRVFVECFGLAPARSASILAEAQTVLEAFRQARSVDSAHLSLHAPYSCSPALRSKLYTLANRQGGRLSIHLLESRQERRFLGAGQGALAAWFASAGFPFPPAQDPVAYLLADLPNQLPVLWVHLTEASASDIQRLRRHSAQAAFVLCPRSNQLLHGRLPRPEIFQDSDLVCLGTDSLASSPDLGLLPELKLLQQACQLPLPKLLRWATWNGARALGWEQRLGALRVGTAPRVLHLGPLHNQCLAPETQVQVLA